MIELAKRYSYLVVRWCLLIVLVGFLAGSASALLLVSLDWATDYRESHTYIIMGLPLAGLLIGLMYHYWGSDVVGGNNLLIDEIQSPQRVVSWRMAPLVLVGTLLTHLFGGSAGREGTAVQMGGSIADQFSRWCGLSACDRRLLLVLGISAGFASVFGTPLAGAVFAIELIVVGQIRWVYLLPSLLVALVANYTCHTLWGVLHTSYVMGVVPAMSAMYLMYAIGVGIAFGLAAMLFSYLAHFWQKLSLRISYAPFRPLVGGVVLVLVVYCLGTTQYIGLGVPTIVASFGEVQPSYAFLIKILLTTFTVGVGFKGGEVTPLFFVGATLGSALSLVVPLPIGLLAGMGFVGVFAGATNTPLACMLMGFELFGLEGAAFIAVSCLVAYYVSGSTSIYASQLRSMPADYSSPKLFK